MKIYKKGKKIMIDGENSTIIYEKEKNRDIIEIEEFLKKDVIELENFIVVGKPINIRKDILQRLISKNGRDHTCEMVIEKCGELISSFQKFKRNDDISLKQKYVDLINCLAAVTILMEQTRLMYDYEGNLQGAIDYQMEQLEKTLNIVNKNG